MKKILLLFLSCFSCTIAEAQTTPPLFQGSDDVQLFRQALMERVTEVYYSDGYTPDDLIHYFWMNFTIDTLGRCIDLEIPDTCRRQTIIVKERTLELLRTALAGIDSFQPATERGEKVPYRQTMEYNFAYIPEVTTPACFKKSEPNDLTVFEKYIAKRVEYPEELRPWGVSGRVIIVFIVNTDGSVEIDKVLESPHPKMSYRVKKNFIDFRQMDTRALFWRSRPTEVCASGRFQVKIKHLHYEKNNFSHSLPDKFAGSSADYSAAICRVGRPGCFSQTIREEGDESHEAGRLPNRRTLA